VENGVTGYLRDSIDDLVDAVASTGNCSPEACRRRVEERFSAPAMVKGYEALFASIAHRSSS
jgi:glycosyltransferase involved in cell wall biosynthesis